MPETKTKPSAVSVESFLAGVEDGTRRSDGQALDALFRRVTGWEPRMWGPTMVGYGRYRYRYDSGRSGEMFATGFSPRKAELVVYLPAGYEALAPELARLGRHRLGTSCLYVRRLADIDMAVLEEILRRGLQELAGRWPVDPGPTA
jgi:hypothetical protein